MREQILQFIEKTDKKWATRRIRQNEEWVSYLDKCFPTVKTLPEKIRFLREGHTTTPNCVNCGSPVNFAHAETCSRECRDAYHKSSGKLQLQLKNAKQTILEQYGVDNAAKLSVTQERRLSTMMEKYGSKVSPKARQQSKRRIPQLLEKGRETLRARYGVENASQLLGHGDKCKDTTRRNFGVDHYSQTDEYQLARIQRRIDQFGVMCDTIEVSNVFATNHASHSNDRIDFRCRCGFNGCVPSETFRWRVKNFMTPCPVCSDIKCGSREQKDLTAFIETLIPNREILANDRNVISPLELDIYIPSKNLAIEYCGLFWHNDERISKQYHSNKRRLCEQLGITLITIFQDEWLYKRDIVASRLRNVLGLVKCKLHARNCHIRPVDSIETNKFLNINHLQGSGRSNVRLGAFHNDELVSVMTFSKPNIAKGSAKFEWELNRFCSRLDTIVSGIASRMLSYFVREFQPVNIVSYADMRWTSTVSPTVYDTIGFRLDEHTSENYWYIRGDKRVHRYALRKNSDDDQSLTEWQNRQLQGWKRIWDCGNLKYVWES